MILTPENKTYLEEVEQKLNQAFPYICFVDWMFLAHFGVGTQLQKY